MDIPRSESLLAVVGVAPFFADEPIRFTADMRRDAERLPVTIRKELRRFVTSDAFDRERPLPEFAYKKALGQLTESMDPVRLADRIAKLDPDDSQELLVGAGRAVEFLKAILPKRTRMTPLGPEPVEPSAADVSAFRRAYGVCNRPMVVLEDLNEGSLARDQMRALEAVYPGLYDAIKEATFEALTQLKTDKPKAELPHKRSKQLSVLLLDAGAIDAPLAKVLQGHFAETDESQPKQGTQLKGDAAQGVDTPTRRLESR